jgi:hypothetical protein
MLLDILIMGPIGQEIGRDVAHLHRLPRAEPTHGVGQVPDPRG